MGLIKAAISAVSGTLADQWKEYFCCDAMDEDVLVVSGYKKTGNRTSNTKSSNNIITDGSVISVADGQAMIIVEQGKVKEFSMEAGAFVYNNKTEPSLFGGDFVEGLKATFETVKQRFIFGGEAVGDQRIYYFNTKEIMGNKYGTPVPIPFRVIDQRVGIDIDVRIRCNGQYSYKIENPILFYENVCGNVSQEFRRSEIDSMLKTELLTALQPAFGKLSENGIRYSLLPTKTMEISDALNEILSKKWRDLRGIVVKSFGMNSVSADPDDEAMLRDLQKTAVFTNVNMAAANMATAQADAMRDAANNSGGAFVGFAGMNMAQNTGGINAQNLYAMGQQQAVAQAPVVQTPQPSNAWTCSCGTENTGKFCMNCGTAKPVDETWTCSCGTVNKGKFCMECGKPKATGFKCDKCGWKPSDMTNVPKFCPECGDPFTDADRC